MLPCSPIFSLALFSSHLSNPVEGGLSNCTIGPKSPDGDGDVTGGGGEAIIREVRKRDDMADLPIVAVTSLAMPGDRERLLGSGFQGYLSKPIDTRTFGPTVEAFLRAEVRRAR